MKRILSVTTYPIVKPRHGGQRRISAFKKYFEAQGLSYKSACVYEPENYSPDLVSDGDLPLGFTQEGWWPGTPLIGDVQSGFFAAKNASAFRHFTKIIERYRPDAIFLDQPFMWPLVAELGKRGHTSGVEIVYSSQNWEAPLKLEMLQRSGVAPRIAHEVAARVEDLERETCLAADAIIAVSESDAKIYRTINPESPTYVIPNGVDRPAADRHAAPQCTYHYGQNKFFFFAGSAYPPNIQGFCDLVLQGGMFFTPPEKNFAICGSVGGGIYNSTHYSRYLNAYSERVQFFLDVSEEELSALKDASHCILLPIEFGGGSNLKTAEAIASGKWVIATSTALRGFERFKKSKGIVIANNKEDYRRLMVEIYAKPSLNLTEKEILLREEMYWDRIFKASELDKLVGNRIDQS